MTDRLTSEQIDEALSRASRSGRFNVVLSIMSLALITVLVLVWVVFGQNTVNKQNTQILQGVQQELAADHEVAQSQLAGIEKDIESIIVKNSIGDRVIVCLLNVDPTKRTNETTQKCLEAAKEGKDHLPSGKEGKHGQSG